MHPSPLNLQPPASGRYAQRPGQQVRDVHLLGSRTRTIHRFNVQNTLKSTWSLGNSQCCVAAASSVSGTNRHQEHVEDDDDDNTPTYAQLEQESLAISHGWKETDYDEDYTENIEDYTWKPDNDLDALEEQALSDQPGMDLTRPWFINDVGIQAEKQLAQALASVYSGLHTYKTLGKRGSKIFDRIVTKSDDKTKASLGLTGLKAVDVINSSGEVLPPVPPRFVGSVRVKPFPGRGWGVTVTEVVEQGDVLLVSEPLAITYTHPLLSADSDINSTSPSTKAASVPEAQLADVAKMQARADLLQQLQQLQRLLPADHAARAALTTLWRGAQVPASTKDLASRSNSDLVVDLRTWLPTPSTPVMIEDQDQENWSMDDWAALQAAQQAALDNAPVHAEAPTLTMDELDAVIQQNAQMFMLADEAVAFARREGGASLVSGLWPELSLVNHSCAPNATAVLIGGRVVVRATRRITPGTEVTINYLATPDPAATLQPAQGRRQALKETWGFNCKCNRCRLEESAEEAIEDVLPVAYEDAMSLWESLKHSMAPYASTGTLSQLLQTTGNHGDGSDGRSTSSARTLRKKFSLEAYLHYWTYQEAQAEQEVRHSDARSASGSRTVAVNPNNDSLIDSITDDMLTMPRKLETELQKLEAAALELKDIVIDQIVAVREVKNNSEAAEQLLAGLYPMYDLLATLRYLLRPESHNTADTLEPVATLLQTALPGSVLSIAAHARCAQQISVRHGPSDKRSMGAETQSRKVLISRYGALETSQLAYFASIGLRLADADFRAKLHSSTSSADQGRVSAVPSISRYAQAFGTEAALKLYRPTGPDTWAPPAWKFEAKKLIAKKKKQEEKEKEALRKAELAKAAKTKKAATARKRAGSTTSVGDVASVADADVVEQPAGGSASTAGDGQLLPKAHPASGLIKRRASVATHDVAGNAPGSADASPAPTMQLEDDEAEAEDFPTLPRVSSVWRTRSGAPAAQDTAVTLPGAGALQLPVGDDPLLDQLLTNVLPGVSVAAALVTPVDVPLPTTASATTRMRGRSRSALAVAFEPSSPPASTAAAVEASAATTSATATAAAASKRRGRSRSAPASPIEAVPTTAISDAVADQPTPQDLINDLSEPSVASSVSAMAAVAAPLARRRRSSKAVSLAPGTVVDAPAPGTTTIDPVMNQNMKQDTVSSVALADENAVAMSTAPTTRRRRSSKTPAPAQAVAANVPSLAGGVTESAESQTVVIQPPPATRKRRSSKTPAPAAATEPVPAHGDDDDNAAPVQEEVATPRRRGRPRSVSVATAATSAQVPVPQLVDSTASTVADLATPGVVTPVKRTRRRSVSVAAAIPGPLATPDSNAASTESVSAAADLDVLGPVPGQPSTAGNSPEIGPAKRTRRRSVSVAMATTSTPAPAMAATGGITSATTTLLNAAHLVTNVVEEQQTHGTALVAAAAGGRNKSRSVRRGMSKSPVPTDPSTTNTSTVISTTSAAPPPSVMSTSFAELQAIQYEVDRLEALRNVASASTTAGIAGIDASVAVPVMAAATRRRRTDKPATPTPAAAAQIPEVVANVSPPNMTAMIAPEDEVVIAAGDTLVAATPKARRAGSRKPKPSTGLESDTAQITTLLEQISGPGISVTPDVNSPLASPSSRRGRSKKPATPTPESLQTSPVNAATVVDDVNGSSPVPGSGSLAGSSAQEGDMQMASDVDRLALAAAILSRQRYSAAADTSIQQQRQPGPEVPSSQEDGGVDGAVCSEQSVVGSFEPVKKRRGRTARPTAPPEPLPAAASAAVVVTASDIASGDLVHSQGVDPVAEATAPAAAAKQKSRGRSKSRAPAMSELVAGDVTGLAAERQVADAAQGVGAAVITQKPKSRARSKSKAPVMTDAVLAEVPASGETANRAMMHHVSQPEAVAHVDIGEGVSSDPRPKRTRRSSKASTPPLAVQSSTAVPEEAAYISMQADDVDAGAATTKPRRATSRRASKASSPASMQAVTEEQTLIAAASDALPSIAIQADVSAALPPVAAKKTRRSSLKASTPAVVVDLPVTSASVSDIASTASAGSSLDTAVADGVVIPKVSEPVTRRRRTSVRASSPLVALEAEHLATLTGAVPSASDGDGGLTTKGATVETSVPATRRRRASVKATADTIISHPVHSLQETAMESAAATSSAQGAAIDTPAAGVAAKKTRARSRSKSIIMSSNSESESTQGVKGVLSGGSLSNGVAVEDAVEGKKGRKTKAKVDEADAAADLHDDAAGAAAKKRGRPRKRNPIDSLLELFSKVMP